MNLSEWLAASARRHPAAPALLAGDRIEADYATFAVRAASLAAALQARFGCAAGDRIAIFMTNRTQYLEALYGALWLGAVVVPINCKLHPRELAWILADAGARLVFTDIAHKAGLAEGPFSTDLAIIDVTSKEYDRLRSWPSRAQPARRSSSDIAWLFYTSGTTGRPKGVMLSHGNLAAMSVCYPIDVDPVAREDATVYAAPISHGAGLYSFIHVRAAARHVVPLSGGFDSLEVLGLGERLGGVSLFAAPTMVRRLVDAAARAGRTGEGIKTIVYGGGPMYQADILHALAVLGPRFVQIYGQGESPMTITALSRAHHGDIDHPADARRLASVGVAQSLVEVRVTREDGGPAEVGEAGEIEVRGATVMLGYWNSEAATAATIRDGWLRTGDVGHLDEDGFLTLVDRSKDVIISGGSNIYPREVEEVLQAHAAVKEVAVVGAPDEEWGETVVAFVVPAQGASVNSSELDLHCRDRVARFKRPRRYLPATDLPKNNNGKVVKSELRLIASQLLTTKAQRSSE